MFMTKLTKFNWPLVSGVWIAGVRRYPKLTVQQLPLVQLHLKPEATQHIEKYTKQH